jgi:hypothetical protein
MIHYFTHDCPASVLEGINFYWHYSSNNLKHRTAHVTFTNAAISTMSFHQAVVTKPRKFTYVSILTCRRMHCRNKARILYDLILIDYFALFIRFHISFFFLSSFFLSFFLSFFRSSFNYFSLSWLYFHDTRSFSFIINQIIKLYLLPLVGQLAIISETSVKPVLWDTKNVFK